MFWFEKDKICFENGKSEYVNSWLCAQTQEVSKMLKGGIPFDCKDVSCKVENGKICYESDSKLSIASVAYAYAINHGINILKCAICSSPFAPVKRNDEKYCLACRKTGAAKTFRQKSAADGNYTLFLQYTKHLRYLKSVLKISDTTFARNYSEAKEALSALRNGKISENEFRLKMGKPIEITGQKTIESYLL